MSNAFGRSRFVGNGALVMVAMLAALGCYTISLKVSAERAAVNKLRAQVVADAHDIRMLQAELRVRARLPELQRWNDSVLVLSAPGPQQFLHTPVQLAAFAPGAPKRVTPPAAAPAPSAAVPAPVTPAPLLPATPRSTNALAPGLKTINYAVPSNTRTRLAPAAVPAAASVPASKPQSGLDAALVDSVANAAAAAPANTAAGKAPME